MDSPPWIDWFLQQPQGRLFVRIEYEYISDFFNLFGIQQKVSHFLPALELITKNYVPPYHADMKRETEAMVIEQQAEFLYGIIHSRYIMTNSGLCKMFEKYNCFDYPQCPRILCNNVKCLPFGISHEYNDYPVKMFCPCCRDIYNMKDPFCNFVDGAFFGPSYIHPFLAKFSDQLKPMSKEIYIPRIFGIRVRKTANVIEDDE